MSAVRLAVTLSALFVLALLISGFVFTQVITNQVRSQIDEDLVMGHQDAIAQGLTAKDITAWFELDDPEWAPFVGLGLRTDDGTVYGAVRDDVFDGDGFATILLTELFQNAQLGPILDGAEDQGYAVDQGDLDLWRVYVAPIEGGRVVYFETVAEVESALGLIPSLLLIVGTVIILITLISGLVLGWRQQRRLDTIRGAIGHLAEGQFHTRIAPTTARDDLDSVMVGVDGAAAQLEQSFDRLKHMSQNMAHELRTPLARLRAQLDQIPESTAQRNALDQADEVIRVFDAVQRIARLSRRADRSTLSAVDLSEVAVLMQDLYADVAEENGQQFEIRAHPTSPVKGDFQMIAQLASNLVENAIRHAGPGVKITVFATGTTLGVRDTGPGVAPEAYERAFTPFERLTATETGQGTGLGLALVRAIADYHDARLTIARKEEGEFEVSAQFSQIT